MDERLVDFEANFSVLDRYGVDVTADTFITNPAIGRDQQIKELMLILLTPEKSAILIGKPGIGKTAIVEGLAYRMQRGEVPDALKGYTIINIKTASLLGTLPSGESKVQKMIDELKTREKVILFVDEVHMLIGATDSSSLDFANIFKEGLGRGSIKVIGATTTEEYERYILRDKAFTRRFQKVEVPEPTREETIQIMMGTYPKFEKQTGRKLKYTHFIQERIMSFLVDITSEYKRVFALGSRYPDVCLTLLKQAFSYTVFDNREYVDIFDIRKAIENSKNIYPDVIKKELPRFDKEFNDIILEEKGEKPVEEWRKESGPTRYQQEANSIIVDTNAGNLNDRKEGPTSIFKNLENTPQMVDRQKLKEYQPVKTILSEKTLKKFAKIGPTAISKGMKEKISRKSDSRNIDNLLLSSEIGVIKENDSSNNFNYMIGDELKPGGLNDLLLGTPISSTLDGLNPKVEPVKETYKSENMFVKELNPNKNSLMIGGSSGEKNNNSSRNNVQSTPKTFGLLDINSAIKKQDSNNQIRQDRNAQKDVYDNRQFNNSNNMYNDVQNNNRQSNSQNMNYNTVEPDLGGFNPNIEKNNDMSNVGSSTLEAFLNQNKINTSSVNEEELYPQTSGKFFGDKDAKDNFLFGVPMYNKVENKLKEETENKPVDIFGQLITDNMHIKGGKIINGLNLESGEQANQIIGDVVNVTNRNLDTSMFDSKNSLLDNNSVNVSESSSNKKWKFLDDFNEPKEKPVPKFNELKIERPKPNNINNSPNSNGFVNFNDLNSGKVSEKEVNQYISLSRPEKVERDVSFESGNQNYNRENVPLVDLTLNDFDDMDNYFDDFYEN